MVKEDRIVIFPISLRCVSGSFKFETSRHHTAVTHDRTTSSFVIAHSSSKKMHYVS